MVEISVNKTTGAFKPCSKFLFLTSALSVWRKLISTRQASSSEKKLGFKWLTTHRVRCHNTGKLSLIKTPKKQTFLNLSCLTNFASKWCSVYCCVNKLLKFHMGLLNMLLACSAKMWLSWDLDTHCTHKLTLAGIASGWSQSLICLAWRCSSPEALRKLTFSVSLYGSCEQTALPQANGKG